MSPCSTHATDPLWDGEGCGAATCCELSYPPGVTPPWFCKQLPEVTTDDIEVRLCADEPTTDEDTLLELIELYILRPGLALLATFFTSTCEYFTLGLGL